MIDIIKIKGITCQACVSRIEKKLLKNEYISKASINFLTNELAVEYEEMNISNSEIIELIKSIGYDIEVPYSSVILDIEGMTCQACSLRIEKKISKLEGISKINVNLATNMAEIIFNENQIKLSEIKSSIENLGYKAFSHKEFSEEKKEKNNSLYKLILSIIFTVPIFYIAMGHMLGLHLPNFINPHHNPLNFALVQLVLTIPVIFSGFGFFTRGFKALKALSPSMDSLIAIGTGSAIIYSLFGVYNIFKGNTNYAMHLYFESAVVIITLVMLGKFLEEKSKKKTSEAIKKLSKLRPKIAHLMRDDQIIDVNIDDLTLNDIILVKSGEIIPSDGVVIDGSSHVDESFMTGESIPVKKSQNSEVYGGSINKNGSLTIKILAIGKDTILSKIIKLVEEAQGSKAPIAKLADKISAYFVPIVMGIATISSLIWYILGKYLNYSLPETPSIFALTIFISVLVIACPCSLGLATPTAIMVGTGRSAQEGILIKGGEPLETLHKIDTIVFDKTGTITEGKPVVNDIIDFIDDKNKLISYVASVENFSEHPLGEAIVNFAKNENISLLTINSFETLMGLGVKAFINNDEVLIGNIKLMSNNSIDNIPYEVINRFSSEGKTPIIVSINKKIAGVISIADKVKEDSLEAISKLKQLGIDIILLTGDNEKVANFIGREVGISNVISDVLPHEKSSVIEKLQSENRIVAMVGDGINDAPSLARANVGIAIGNGTDIAIESADVILLKNSINDVFKAISLSKITMKNIKQNLFWAFFYNIVGIPIAAGILYPFTGHLLNPMIAGGAMALSSVSVVTNALRLKNIKF